jgi:hypothetical protein
MGYEYVKMGRFVAAGLMLCAIGACGDDSAGGASGSVSATGLSATATATETGSGTESSSDATAASASADGSTGSADDTTTGASVDSTGSLDDSTSGASLDDDGSTSGNDSGASASADDGNNTSAGTAGDNCEAPGDPTPCDADSDEWYHALGLNCPYGPNEAIPISNPVFHSQAANAWRVARQFGTHMVNNEPLWGPKEGEKFLIISTGNIAAPNAQGVITMSNGSHEPGVDNANPGNQQLPPPMTAARGSNNGAGGTPFINCDGIGDCSDSLQAQWSAGGSAANDLLWFQFEVDVPGDTHGFEFDFAYFSAEFPDWVNTTFNDIFVVWSNSETYTGNLCFVDDQPCTVTALWPVQHQGNAAALAGTGFPYCPFELFGNCIGGWKGGGTGWYSAKASAAPGETLQLTWAVFDMGDSILDTAVILDNWRWDCQGCVPSEVNPCGIRPIPQ